MDLQSQTQAFQLVQQWRNGSGSRLRDRASTHRVRSVGQRMDLTRIFWFKQRNRLFQNFLVQYGGIHGFSQSQTQTFRITGTHEGSCRTRDSRTLRARTRSGSPIEWEKEPPHGPPWPFYSHAPGLTLVTHGTACVPPARITSSPWSET
jgi:hypothetical protein